MNCLLNSVAERNAQKALSLKSFQSLNLENIKKSLCDSLNELRSNRAFHDYTQHDISHIDGMLLLVNDIIPKKTADNMTASDWIMLVLSIYFHDFGMLITNDEFDNKDNDNDFLDYRKKHATESWNEEEMYQNYVRDNHHIRIYDWLISLSTTTIDKDTDTHLRILYDLLGSLSDNILLDLAKLCKSHGEELGELVPDLDVSQQYEQDGESRVNLLYIASVLRTADLLHINSERTPSIVYKILAPKNHYSITEWNFQKSITCILPFRERDKDEVVIESQPHSFEIRGSFKDEDAYSRFKDYVSMAERQLVLTHDICKESSFKNKNSYDFPWDSINCTSIKTEGFSAEPLKFELDKNNILDLLIGHTLYSNANVVLRELAQNAIDACRLLNRNSKEGSFDYQPTVVISWNSQRRELTVQDNGTGMNEHIIKEYLFKVGVSRYQSAEFKSQNSDFHSISRFGIGLLTCFMISDEFDIYTLWHEEKKAHKLKIKGVSGDYIMRNDASSDKILGHKHGTTFILKVKDSVKFNDIAKNLRRWIIVPQCKVIYKEDNLNDQEIGYIDEETALINNLKQVGISVDNRTYRLKTYENRGLCFKFLEKKDELFGDWTIYSLNYRLSAQNIPIGQCVEGIMVSGCTPGFKDRNFVGLLNATGTLSPTTNVARDRFEHTDEYENMLKFVYDSYLSSISDKIDFFKEKHQVAWSINEANFSIDRFIDSNNRRAIVDIAIFNKSLSEKNFYLLDTDGQYKQVSLNNFGDSVWTIESYTFSSAMQLSLEIPNCRDTAFGILQHLGEKFNKELKHIYSDFSNNHYTSELFLDEYEIVKILTDDETKKIEYKWSKKENRWYCLKAYGPRRYYNMINVFLLRKDSCLDTNLTENIHFIKSKLGLLIIAKTPLSDLLWNLVSNQEDDRNLTAVSIISAFILRMVTNGKSEDIENDLDHFLDEDVNTLGQDISNYININNLKKLLKEETFESVDYGKYYTRIKDY